MDLNRTDEIEDDSGLESSSDPAVCATIVKCSRCRFWCSDARYIKLHMEVEHHYSVSSELSQHPAVKKFRKEESGNVEDIIKIAHTLMGQLYGLLLDSNSKLVENVERKEIGDQAKQLIANLHQSAASPKAEPVQKVESNRKRKRPSEEVQRINPTTNLNNEHQHHHNHHQREANSESPLPLFDLQSLLAKSRQGAFTGNLLNLAATGSTTPTSVAPPLPPVPVSTAPTDQQPSLDRTQLLFETIRAAQAAQQQQQQQQQSQAAESDDEQPDAVVNPSDPPKELDLEEEQDDDDEIEIIHAATDDTDPEIKQEALTFPSSDTLSRSNMPFYSRSILTQIQKSNSASNPPPPSAPSPVGSYDTKMDLASPYSLASFASLTAGSQNGAASLALNSANATNSKTPISCSICGSHWRTPSALNIHMRVHTGEKPYTCYVCGKGHKQKGQLKVHMNKHHPGRWFGGQVYCKDPKKCSMCGEVFNDPKDLSKHILECAPNGVAPKLLGVNGPGTGGGGAKLTCEVCGAYFTSQATYKRHLDSHKEQSGQFSLLSTQLTPKAQLTIMDQSSPQTPPETPRLSDFNSNQNSSVNSIAESLLARLKQNSALLQYKMAQQAASSSVASNPGLDLKALAANLIQSQVQGQQQQQAQLQQHVQTQQQQQQQQQRHISSDSLSNSSSNNSTVDHHHPHHHHQLHHQSTTKQSEQVVQDPPSTCVLTQ